MSCCGSGVGGTKKWAGENKGQIFFGTLNTKLDLKGSLGRTQNLAKRHLQDELRKNILM